MRTTFSPYNPAIVTYYFRTTFEFDGNFNGSDVRIRHYVDDGAMFLLERARSLRGPAWRRARSIADDHSRPSASATRRFPALRRSRQSMLLTGTNTLAVEVHQNATTRSSDIVFGAEVVLQKTIVNPGVGTPTLALNEISGATAMPASRSSFATTTPRRRTLAGHVIGRVRA